MKYSIKFSKNIIVLLVTILILSSSFVYANEINENEKLDADLDYLKLVIEFLKQNHVDDITYDELIEGAMKGLFINLDEYSSYYTPEEFEKFNQQTSGNFGGIGVHIMEKNDFITVLSPIKGTPGFKAGINANDKIYSVDDIVIKGYSLQEAAELIRGEVGTSVKLGIIREGIEGLLYFDVVRDIIKINPVSYEILENNIGYIKITQFNINTLENINEALSNFNKKDIKKIIIDIRNNPGGYLDQVIEVLKNFIPEGPIVHVKNNDGNIETYSSSLKNKQYKLAVLVNEGSASASEIFAGAVQDAGIGTIIGETTFGKGTVQSITPITNGGGIKLTIAEYFTRDMNKVNGIGITPDIIVENKLPEPKVDLTKIPTLDKARKPKLGTVGLDVLGAEMILSTLGYKVDTLDGILDKVTFEAIKKFQKDSGLYGYGVLDFSTQDKLTKAINEYAKPEIVDYQLEKAVETLSK